MLHTLKKAFNVLSVCLNTEITASSISSLKKADTCGLQLVSATAMELHTNALLGKQTQSPARWLEG